MKKKLAWLLILLGMLMVILAACGPAATPAPTAVPPTPTLPPPPTVAPTEAPPPLTGDAARGGRLYDKWTEELGLEVPAGNHPLWGTQSTNTRTGSDTWRCKECHGWDYKGVDGAYGSGSHKTGFKGTMGASGKDPHEILAILKGSSNPDHDFSAYMDEQALIDLSLFLSGTLMDYSTMINADKSLIGGDAVAGKTFFNDVCSVCHGPQGLGLNFGNASEPEYQGTIAVDNPWEFVHKMRYGQPAFPSMPSLIDDGVSEADFANVLTYAATFPSSAPISEGGVLYDNWMKATGAAVPATDQPLWATQSTNTRTGADTWRCKECHGWDYKGVEGAYGSGSHKTGFKGVFSSASLSAEELTAWLDGTKNPDHNFAGEGMLGEAQVAMLVAFLQSEKADTSAFINTDKTIVSGDAAHGQEMFNDSCADCHGQDGKVLNFGSDAEPEFVGTIAADNPWEFVHKVSVGQPGAVMPAGINMGWTLQDIIDMLAYTQTLPAK